MNLLHPLSRPHLLNLKSVSSGMPKENFDNASIRRLHLNLNHYVDSSYIYYPNEVNPSLYTHFLEYLRLESQEKENKIPENSLNEDQLLFIASSESVDLIIRGFCEPAQDAICIMNPTFPYYAFAAQSNNVEVLNIPLTGENFENLQLDQIFKLQPKVIFLPVPNNPVGSIPNRKQVLTLIKEAPGLVVLDEAYIEFADESSYVSLVHQYSNLIILRSFSKVWGMAGLRSGVTIAHPKIIQTLKQVRPPCSFPTHTQKLILQMLKKPELVFRVRDIAKAERGFLVEQLKELKNVVKIYPSEANFILVEFKNCQEVLEKLAQADILVRQIDPLVPNTLRISLGTRQDHLELIKTLKIDA